MCAMIVGRMRVLVLGFGVIGATLFGAACSSEEADQATPSPSPDIDEDAAAQTSSDPTADASTPDADSAIPMDAGDAALPSGCGKAGAPTGVETRTMTIAGKPRSFILVVPQSYDPTRKVAVVFGFYPGPGSEARATFEIEAESKDDAIVIYPTPLENAQGLDRWSLAKGSNDFTFVERMTNEVFASHCVDRKRVFAMGFSNGGRMAAELGCWRDDLFRAVAPVAPGAGGATPQPLTGCAGTVAVWEAIGTQDSAHYDSSVLIRDSFVTANDCKKTTQPTPPAGCVAYDGCRAAAPVTFCTHGGKHIWPSFATSAAWSFFKRQS